MSVTERVLMQDDADFPRTALTVRPQPRTLFVRGDVAVLRRRMVAIVGARDPSPYGMKVAWEAATACARAGLVVVSGMARGLDAQAHRATIAAGGLTVGVLGCGLDVAYPRQNADLRASIPEHGALVTEFPAGTRPAPWTFPQRNRLIAALADALVVVEGRVKSGTANTVEWVTTLNKTIFAVPGRVDDALSAGPNLLIQQGATLYRGPGDVFFALGLPAPEDARPEKAFDVHAARAELHGAEATLFDLMTPQPVHVDLLTERTAMDPGLLLAALSTLELQGLIQQLPGKRFALAS